MKKLVALKAFRHPIDNRFIGIGAEFEVPEDSAVDYVNQGIAQLSSSVSSANKKGSSSRKNVPPKVDKESGTDKPASDDSNASGDSTTGDGDSADNGGGNDSKSSESDGS